MEISVIFSLERQTWVHFFFKIYVSCSYIAQRYILYNLKCIAWQSRLPLRYHESVSFETCKHWAGLSLITYRNTLLQQQGQKQLIRFSSIQKPEAQVILFSYTSWSRMSNFVVLTCWTSICHAPARPFSVPPLSNPKPRPGRTNHNKNYV